MTPLVVNQELIVHLFAPLDGPHAAEAQRQIRQLWAACAVALGMTEPIPGLGAPAQPSADFSQLSTDSVAAGQQGQASNRQIVLRRVHDVLNISAALPQPAPEESASPAVGRLRLARVKHQPAQQRLGWVDLAQLWARARGPAPDAMLGEVALYLAQMPSAVTGPVAATAELGKSLDALLPYREDRAPGWWRWGITAATGVAVWDLRPASDTGGFREIVLVAGADQDEELSAWAWSDGTASTPPLAQYLMHVAKLRYEARLLEAWHDSPRDEDVDELLAELEVALAPVNASGEKAGLLGSWLSRLRAQENRLMALEAEFARLGRTAAIAQRNLSAVPGCEPGGEPHGMFAADQALAQWLTGQVEDDLGYLRIDLSRTAQARSLAAEEFEQLRRGAVASGSAADGPAAGVAGHRAPAGQPGDADAARRVFVVHGRDAALTGAIEDLLRAVKLEPLAWETLVRATGTATPYLGQALARAPHLAQATLVLLSPDDVVELHSDLYETGDKPYERARAGQARPNVLFELGLALMAYPERTVIVEVGQMRPVADLAGLNVIHFDGSAVAVNKMLDRLEQAGCPVDTSSGAWLEPGRFAALRAWQRGPGNHRGAPADPEGRPAS